LIATAARAFTQTNSWNIDLTLTQNLYSGGRISASIASAKFNRGSGYYTLRDTLDRVVGQVRQQFSQVLVTEALVDVAQESVELATQQLKDAQNRYSAGTVPRFTVLRAEVELASVKPQLIRSKNDFLIAQLQLAKLLALDPGAKGKPTFRCVGQLEISDRPLGLEESLTLGRARRPSLKALREQMLGDKEGIKVALAGFKPELNINGGARLQNKIGTNHLDKTMDGYFLGITGSWRIFDSFETVGQVAQAKAKLRSDTLAYEDAVRQVELEVQKAYADLLQFRETIESQQKNVQQALEALRLAQERLSAGAGTQLEVLDARVALTRARTTELQARGDYVRSLAEFDRATATQTVYAEQFKDPLQKLEHQVLHRDYSSLFKP
jgi:outer membrane protein